MPCRLAAVAWALMAWATSAAALSVRSTPANTQRSGQRQWHWSAAGGLVRQWTATALVGAALSWAPSSAVGAQLGDVIERVVDGDTVVLSKVRRPRRRRFVPRRCTATHRRRRAVPFINAPPTPNPEQLSSARRG